MAKLFLDKLILKEIRTRVLDYNDIYSFIKFHLNDFGLAHYVRTIFPSKNSVSAYDFFEYKLRLDIGKVISDTENLALKHKKFYLERGFDFNECLYINLYILFTILHELGHALENYDLTCYPNDPEIIIMKEEIDFSCLKRNRAIYDKYHDYFLHERFATFNALDIIINTIIENNYDNGILDSFLQDFLHWINVGYEIKDNNLISPIETIVELMDKKELLSNIDINSLDSYTRLKKGYPITLIEYENRKKTVLKKYLSNTCYLIK
ncbi:MAG: hypothetical protein J1F35_00620 [Erysipelotrichales bacterium]|nr:hypothetical protein [Erysipelotrichales bacterium]